MIPDDTYPNIIHEKHGIIISHESELMKESFLFFVHMSFPASFPIDF